MICPWGTCLNFFDRFRGCRPPSFSEDSCSISSLPQGSAGQHTLLAGGGLLRLDLDTIVYFGDDSQKQRQGRKHGRDGRVNVTIMCVIELVTAPDT